MARSNALLMLIGLLIIVVSILELTSQVAPISRRVVTEREIITLPVTERVVEVKYTTVTETMIVPAYTYTITANQEEATVTETEYRTMVAPTTIYRTTHYTVTATTTTWKTATKTTTVYNYTLKPIIELAIENMAFPFSAVVYPDNGTYSVALREKPVVVNLVDQSIASVEADRCTAETIQYGAIRLFRVNISEAQVWATVRLRLSKPVESANSILWLAVLAKELQAWDNRVYATLPGGGQVEIAFEATADEAKVPLTGFSLGLYDFLGLKTAYTVVEYPMIKSIEVKLYAYSTPISLYMALVFNLDYIPAVLEIEPPTSILSYMVEHGYGRYIGGDIYEYAVSVKVLLRARYGEGIVCEAFYYSRATYFIDRNAYIAEGVISIVEENNKLQLPLVLVIDSIELTVDIELVLTPFFYY